MRRVRRLVEEALDQGIFPGAVVLAARDGAVVYEEAFGLTRYGGPPVTTDTLFDLASLTKPLAAAAVCAVLAGGGLVSPDAPCGAFLPAFRDTDKAGITLAQLLGHAGGFRPWAPVYRHVQGAGPALAKKRLARLLAGERLRRTPGAATWYSDLGYMALGLVLESAGGQGLDRLFQERVAGPLGVSEDLRYLPCGAGLPADRLFAATENRPSRGGLVHGQVHDENCAALGGVCAHAGLFGTAHGVWAVVQAFLDACAGNTPEGVFAPEVARRFLTERPGPGSYTLGFDTPTRPGSSSGSHFSDASVGHLGFTGTSFWADPGRDTVIVLLTNRVHPTARNRAIRGFRPRLSDAVWEGLFFGG